MDVKRQKETVSAGDDCYKNIFSNPDRHVTIIQNACFKKLGFKSLHMAAMIPLNPAMHFFENACSCIIMAFCLYSMHACLCV